MKECEEDAIVAIVLPYTKAHIKVIKTVEKTLNSLKILTIWCDGVDITIGINNNFLEEIK